MLNEEATKTNELTNEYCLERFNDWYEHGFSHAAMPSSGVLMKLKEALEMQIPSKPILDILNVAQPMYCPVCEGIVKIPQPYCTWCGQKLEWTETI